MADYGKALHGGEVGLAERQPHAMPEREDLGEPPGGSLAVTKDGSEVLKRRLTGLLVLGAEPAGDGLRLHLTEGEALLGDFVPPDRRDEFAAVLG